MQEIRELKACERLALMRLFRAAKVAISAARLCWEPVLPEAVENRLKWIAMTLEVMEKRGILTDTDLGGCQITPEIMVFLGQLLGACRAFATEGTTFAAWSDDLRGESVGLAAAVREVQSLGLFNGRPRVERGT